MGWGGGEDTWQVSFCVSAAQGVAVVGSAVVKGAESEKGSYDLTAKRLAMLRSSLPAVGNERSRNYLRRGEPMPRN